MNGIWKVIVPCLLTALLTFSSSYYFYLKEMDVDSLDIHKVFNPNVLSKPEFISNDLSLTVDGIEKDRIGIFYISLVNFSTKDLTDTPVYIKVTPDNPERFKLLSYSAVGAEEVAELVTETREMEFDGASYNFEYMVSTLNRVVAEPDHGMQLRILFEGDQEPYVAVVAKGIGTREYNPANSPYENRKQLVYTIKAFFIVAVFLFLVIALLLLVIFPVMSHLTKSADVKMRKKQAKSMYETMKEQGLRKDLDDEQLKLFVADLLYEDKKRTWTKLSPVLKWSNGLIPPKREDYLVTD